MEKLESNNNKMQISGYSKVEFLLHEALDESEEVDSRINGLGMLVFSLDHIRSNYSEPELLRFINVLADSIDDLELAFNKYKKWIKGKAIPRSESEIESIMKENSIQSILNQGAVMNNLINNRAETIPNVSDKFISLQIILNELLEM